LYIDRLYLWGLFCAFFIAENFSNTLLGDRTNQLRNSLKQSQALKIQGFYRRARQILEAIQSTLSDVNDPLLKAIALHNYGDILIAVGELKLARKPLEQSLALLETNAPKQIGDELSGCDLNIIQLLGSNRKPILIEIVPELLPTSRS
jgi:tetratricopeptide (TPR) repeat protein